MCWYSVLAGIAEAAPYMGQITGLEDLALRLMHNGVNDRMPPLKLKMAVDAVYRQRRRVQGHRSAGVLRLLREQGTFLLPLPSASVVRQYDGILGQKIRPLCRNHSACCFGARLTALSAHIKRFQTMISITEQCTMFWGDGYSHNGGLNDLYGTVQAEGSPLGTTLQR
jgi:hypothetical protein